MKTYHITQKQLDETPQRDRKWRWPGVTGPGTYTWNEATNRYQPAPTPTPTDYDFDHTGLGIGGAGRHNLHDETLELIARDEMRIIERKRTGPMPHGQLWEPCPRCGKEPVCLDCGFCENHCTC